MSFIVVVRRLRVRILTSVFFLNKISKFFLLYAQVVFPFFFFVYEPRFCVCVGGAVYKNIRSLLGPAPQPKSKHLSTSRFFFPNVVHLSLLSIFRHGGVFSICKSQSHKPRNDLKSSIVFINIHFESSLFTYSLTDTGCSLSDQHILSQINPKYNHCFFFRFTQIVLKFKTKVLQVLSFRTIYVNLTKSEKKISRHILG